MLVASKVTRRFLICLLWTPGWGEHDVLRLRKVVFVRVRSSGVLGIGRLVCDLAGGSVYNLPGLVVVETSTCSRNSFRRGLCQGLNKG